VPVNFQHPNDLWLVEIWLRFSSLNKIAVRHFPQFMFDDSIQTENEKDQERSSKREVLDQIEIAI
jgi:hypothetical protein